MNRYQRRAAKSSRKIPRGRTKTRTPKGAQVINFGNRPVCSFQTTRKQKTENVEATLPRTKGLNPYGYVSGGSE